jgi:hypothetical protein
MLDPRFGHRSSHMLGTNASHALSLSFVYGPCIDRSVTGIKMFALSYCEAAPRNTSLD